MSVCHKEIELFGAPSDIDVVPPLQQRLQVKASFNEMLSITPRCTDVEPTVARAAQRVPSTITLSPRPPPAAVDGLVALLVAITPTLTLQAVADSMLRL